MRIRSWAISVVVVLTAGLGATSATGAPTPATQATSSPSSPSPFRQISTGGIHSCGVTTNGRAFCWGDNSSGQLGIGNYAASARPRAVTGLPAPVVTIAVGANHTCAALTTGSVKCWGWNGGGALGIGSDGEFYPRPQQVKGLTSGWASVNTGSNTTCARSQAGSVKCWGMNLDDGGESFSTTPRNIAGLQSGVTGMAIGYSHACAIKAGSVWCWGLSFRGELGDGTDQDRPVPTKVPGLTGVTKIAAGLEHTCALNRTGAVWCWGAAGSVGTGQSTDAWRPVRVPSLSHDVTDMGSASVATCAVRTAGALLCWGWNTNGELGTGSMADAPTPTPVRLLTSGVTQVDGAYGIVCGVRSGTGYCWGLNNYGQLGIAVVGGRRLVPQRLAY